MAPTHPWVFIFNWRCFAIHGAAAGAVFAPTQGSKRIKIEARRAIQENWKWDGELFVLSASAFLLFFASALKASSPSSPPAVFHFNFLEESNNTFAFKSFRSTPKCGGGDSEREEMLKGKSFKQFSHQWTPKNECGNKGISHFAARRNSQRCQTFDSLFCLHKTEQKNIWIGDSWEYT